MNDQQEFQIAVGESQPIQPTHQKESLREKLHRPVSKRLAGRGGLGEKIKIGNDLPKADVPDQDLNALITQTIDLLNNVIINPKIDPQQKDRDFREVMDEIKSSALSTERKVRFSAEVNQLKAKEFAQAVRTKHRELIVNPTHDLSRLGEWFNGGDLSYLMKRWFINAAILQDASRHHFLLALTPPQKEANRWKVLVYDPLTGQNGQTEYFYYLPGDWDANTADPFKMQIENNFSNMMPETWESFKNGTYDLRLYGDQEITAAKNSRTQFNGSDCGILCLFGAAIRLAYKKGWNEFKFTGRDLLDKDTGVKIFTREEI